MRLAYEDIEVFIPMDQQDEQDEALVAMVGEQALDFILGLDAVGLDGLGLFLNVIDQVCSAHAAGQLVPTADELIEALRVFRENPVAFAAGTVPGVWVTLKRRVWVDEPQFQATPTYVPDWAKRPSTLGRNLNAPAFTPRPRRA